jgi:hypothetical protein
MGTILFFFIIFLLFTSCESEQSTTGSESELKYSGTFIPTSGITLQVM